LIPLPDKTFSKKFEAVRDLVLAEVNVKEVEYIEDTSSVLVKKIKPDFRKLGPKYGKMMKDISNAVAGMSQKDIYSFEAEGSFSFEIKGQVITLSEEDVEIFSEDIPGWQVANEGRLTVALDVSVTDELHYEGIARELVNRVQNIRKENGYDVTDKIKIIVEDKNFLKEAVNRHSKYIGTQTLATSIEILPDVDGDDFREIDIDNVNVKVKISKDQ
jgi:isoleucyl-tRNA synthetase